VLHALLGLLPRRVQGGPAAARCAVSGLGVVVLAVAGSLALLGGAALVLTQPRTWRAPRPRPPRASSDELRARREQLAARRAAEVAPRAHPLGWSLVYEGGVLAAYGPQGQRDIYSSAACGWVRS
jgi:hypothetical protein